MNTRYFKDGVVEFGLQANCTVLHAAMCFACVEIVQMLLKRGADPHIDNKKGMELKTAKADNAPRSGS